MANSTLPGWFVVMKTRLTPVPKTALLFAVIVAGSSGCGRQATPTAPTPLTPPSSSSPSPVPTPSPGPTTNTVPAANNGEVGVYRLEAAMSRSGTATVTLTWPNADFSLQLFVTSGVCADTAGLVTGGCSTLGSTRPGSLRAWLQAR